MNLMKVPFNPKGVETIASVPISPLTFILQLPSALFSHCPSLSPYTHVCEQGPWHQVSWSTTLP